MDKGNFLKVPGQTDSEMDKYTASIELSNACRQFYQSRLEAAHGIKSRWERHAHSTCCAENSNDNCPPANSHPCSSTSSSTSSTSSSTSSSTPTSPSTSTSTQRQRNSIDEAMDRLRTEMTSLMDQDLSLMKQLLTLNETIEELKWQRRYYYSKGSLPGSSTDLRHSDCSISDTEMYESDDELLHTTRASSHVPTTTTASSSRLMPLVVLTPSSSSSSSSTRQSTTAAEQGSGCEKKGVVTCRVSEGPSVKVFHSEQDSFDSGFHEASSEEEAVVSC